MHRTFGILTAAAVTVVAVAGCSSSGDSGGAWAAESSQRSSANATFNARIDPLQHVTEGYHFCLQQISGQLKAPATAKFSPLGASHEVINGSRFSFTGTVDSENSFGALLRSTWTCEVTWMGGSSFVADQATVGGG